MTTETLTTTDRDGLAERLARRGWHSVGNSVHFRRMRDNSYRVGRRRARPGDAPARNGLTWVAEWLPSRDYALTGKPVNQLGTFSSAAAAKRACADHALS